MAKDAYWFRHDSNAKTDTKILRIRAIHGWAGYGMYFGIIEVLREQPGYKWLSEESELQLLSKMMDIEVAKFLTFYRDCIKVGLLFEKDGHFFSHSLNHRMEKWESSKKNGKSGGRPQREQADTDIVKTQKNPNKSQLKPKGKPTINPTESIIGEEKRKEDIIIKEKKSNLINSSKNEIPHISEVQTFFYQNGHESDCGIWASAFMDLNEKKYKWLGLSKQTWQEMAENFKLVDFSENEESDSPYRKYTGQE